MGLCLDADHNREHGNECQLGTEDMTSLLVFAQLLQLACSDAPELGVQETE